MNMDVLAYKTLGKNVVLKLGLLGMIGAGGVEHYYSHMSDPMPLRLSKLALYVGAALGIGSSIAPSSVKPDLPSQDDKS